MRAAFRDFSFLRKILFFGINISEKLLVETNRFNFSSFFNFVLRPCRTLKKSENHITPAREP